MKSARLFFLMSIGFSLATACSDASPTASSDGGTNADSGSGSGGGSGSSSGSSSGGGSSGDSGSSSGSAGGADCTTDPCTAPLVCCPATNTCTPNTSADCPSTVTVACTKASDCPGQKCCVGASSTTGSGPTGSLCQATCMSDPACGKGGLADCPNMGASFALCAKIPNSPASLGDCVPASGDDGGGADTGTRDTGTKDTGTAKDAAHGG